MKTIEILEVRDGNGAAQARTLMVDQIESVLRLNNGCTVFMISGAGYFTAESYESLTKRIRETA